ncbi:MAG: hypothetical protein QOI54_1137 [Actinomycetota bacterium]|jgi:hypothetical protein|nr:hypothetical protein [Actinomycetota bacterium]
MTGLDDRLVEKDASLIAEFIEVGELGLDLEQIADVLSEDGTPVSLVERKDMLDLVVRMAMVANALRLCPDRP